MQTARRLQDRTQRLIPNRNPILDWLLEEGTFDCNGNTDTPNSFEEFAMGHSSAMANRLLMCIESLEAEVCISLPKSFSQTEDLVAFQLSHAKTGFGDLYQKEKRQAEREEETT
jgi:hypothetical protein